MFTHQVPDNPSNITYLHQILQSKHTLTLSQIPPHYPLSPLPLNKILNHQKLQYKLNNQSFLYPKHQNKPYTKSQTIHLTHSHPTKSLNI
ncbi:phage antirepressor KilAC domain-containing protein, partial [Bacillus thuringiensis]|uniref:phage antirepressor KilAC domain-containing protein n=1 Tax=Bacillus thuringiensis TaxID=1428 RepID=UPI003D6D76DA